MSAVEKTKLLDHLAPDETSRLSLARLLDQLEQCRRRSIPTHSHFLTDGEQKLAERAVAAAGGEAAHLFYGGYEGAQRQACLFLPDWQEDFTPGGEDDPLSAVETPLPREGKLTHRDFLGALMGLGMTRDVLGDILVGEESCQVVCLKSVLPVLLDQWSEAGRYPVSPRQIPLAELRAVESRVLRRTETFQSLRFDAVAAAGFGLSRAKAASLISSGRLLVNHLPCAKPDRILEEGDSLTGKGLGKCTLTKVNGLSRKGRILAEMERYL